MKKILTLTILFTALLVAAVSCKKDDPKPAPGKDDPKNPPTQQKVEVTEVKLNKPTLTLVVDEKETLKATITPANATDKAVTWSSDKLTVAKVDAKSGEITALAAGEATITAKAGSKTATCKVTVKEKTVAVESVTLDKSELTLTEGSNITLKATIAPDNATNKEVTWESSNTEIATVDQEGNVEAIAAGTVAIAVVSKQDVSKRAACIITVEKLLVAVESVSLDKSEADMFIGKLLTLNATITPTNASNKYVIWSSSDETIATVDQSGSVRAVAEGEAIITATTSDGGKIASCTINVLPTPVEGVSLDKTEAEIILSVAPKVQLTAIIAPEDASNKSVTWSSSDATVATVDTNGEVTAVAVGEATITVTTADGGKTASCKINVVPIPITAIEIVPVSITIKESKVKQLDLKFTPAESTASKKVEWSSSDVSVATIDADGKLTALKPGTVVIQAELKSNPTITASCNVTVERDYTLKGIRFSVGDSYSIKVNNTFKMDVVYTPNYDATNKTIKSWTSSNTAVATVSEDGTVTALSVGKTVITAISQEGEFEATCIITVEENLPDIYAVINSIGVPQLYKNFVYYDAGRVNSVQIENGNLYYDAWNHFDGCKIYKNDNVVANYPTENQIQLIAVSNDTIYILGSEKNSDPRHFSLHKVDPNGTISEMNCPYTGGVLQIKRLIKASADGSVYLAGYEYNASNIAEYKLWTISPNGNISEILLPNSVADMSNDSQGNTWIAVQEYSTKTCHLYKNGTYQEKIATPNLFTNGYIKLCFKGDDRYILYRTNSGVNILKNNAMLYTIEIDNVGEIVDMEVTSTGDIYWGGESNNTVFIYRNNVKISSYKNSSIGGNSLSEIEIVE